MRERSSRRAWRVAAACGLLAASAAQGAEFIGLNPYVCAGSSPFASTAFDVFERDTFESGAMSAPGLSASAGAVLPPGAGTDSVDCDDGAVDSFGRGGHSWGAELGEPGVVFSFDAGALRGRLPTHAGVVWTDGATVNTVVFEALGPGGESLGVLSFPFQGDESLDGRTSEDRFVGVIFAAGISAIRIAALPAPATDGETLEVDHVQFGVGRCDGDADWDGAVSFPDVVAVLRNWGGAYAPATGPGDADRDGVVSFPDVVAVLRGWGDFCY
ncbi:MAG: hypothetical protein SFZ24_05875 [Planctomycetota bacterium]|nr:hypothetical protein [Planctomycetota bacterium]